MRLVWCLLYWGWQYTLLFKPLVWTIIILMLNYFSQEWQNIWKLTVLSTIALLVLFALCLSKSKDKTNVQIWLHFKLLLPLFSHMYLILKNICWFLFYLYRYFVFKYMFTMYMYCLWRRKEGIGCPGIRIIDGWRPSWRP